MVFFRSLRKHISEEIIQYRFGIYPFNALTEITTVTQWNSSFASSAKVKDLRSGRHLGI